MYVRRPFTLDLHEKIYMWPPFIYLNKLTPWLLTSEVKKVKTEAKNTKINFIFPSLNLVGRTCQWFWASPTIIFWPRRLLEVKREGQCTRIYLTFASQVMLIKTFKTQWTQILRRAPMAKLLALLIMNVLKTYAEGFRWFWVLVADPKYLKMILFGSLSCMEYG